MATIQSTIITPHTHLLLLNDDRGSERAIVGRRLAELLQPYRGGDGMVLALPPGGVAVASAIARALRLPLDVIVAHEFTVRPYAAAVVGAVSEGGGLCLNAAALRMPGVTLTTIWREALAAQQAIASLVTLYRRARPLPLLSRRPIILVDDGLRSGLAHLAAMQALRRAHPRRCIVATPGGSAESLALVARYVDEVVALAREEHWAASQAYWAQPLSDDAAAVLLEQRRCHENDTCTT